MCDFRKKVQFISDVIFLKRIAVRGCPDTKQEIYSKDGVDETTYTTHPSPALRIQLRPIPIPYEHAQSRRTFLSKLESQTIPELFESITVNDSPMSARPTTAIRQQLWRRGVMTISIMTVSSAYFRAVFVMIVIMRIDVIQLSLEHALCVRR